MRRWMMSGGLLNLAMILGSPFASAGDDATEALIRKGIASLGGAEKLTKATQGMSYKIEGKLTIQGNDSSFNSETSTSGMHKIRSEFRGEINGEPLVVLTVLDGAKGWRKLNGGNSDIQPEQMAQDKRNIYLVVVPMTLVALMDKDQGFKYEADGEDKVSGKAVKVVKVTAPDSKNFRLFLDSDSGLPLKMTATIVGPSGDEYDQATTFTNYKDMHGIQKATTMEMTRDGERFISGTVTEFHVEDQPAATFAEPKQSG